MPRLFFGCLLVACALFSPSLTPTAAAKTTARMTHARTGFVFPESVGPFHRTRMTKYNTSGTDLSVGYVAANGWLTLYVYPASAPYPPAIDAQLARARSEIRQLWRGVKSVSKRPISITRAGRQYAGREEVFTGVLPQIGSAKTWLLLYKRADYYVMVRFSSPLGKSAAAETELRQFMARLEWPQERLVASSL